MARHGYLRDLVSTDSDNAVFLETLCSATNGAGVVIGTRTRKPLDGTEMIEHDDGRQPAERPVENAGSWDTSSIATTASRSGDGYTLSGTKTVTVDSICEWFSTPVLGMPAEK